MLQGEHCFPPQTAMTKQICLSSCWSCTKALTDDFNKCIFTKASWPTQTWSCPQVLVSCASQAVTPSLWRGTAGPDLLPVSDVLWSGRYFQGHSNHQVCSNRWHFQWAPTLTRLPWVTETQHWLIMQISTRQRTLLKLMWRTFLFYSTFFSFFFFGNVSFLSFLPFHVTRSNSLATLLSTYKTENTLLLFFF